MFARGSLRALNSRVLGALAVDAGLRARAPCRGAASSGIRLAVGEEEGEGEEEEERKGL